MAGRYDFSMMPEEDDEQQYQEVGGFRVPVYSYDNPVSANEQPPAPAAKAFPGRSVAQDSVLDSTALPAELKSLIGNGTPRMEQVPKPPELGMSGMVEKRSVEANPIDPNTVVNGKKIYRMGLGQRLLGALANFGSGMNRQGPVVYTGPGATNRRYAETVDQQNQRVNALDKQIAQTKDVSEEMRRVYDEGLKAAYQGNLLDIKGQEADTKQQLADTRKQLADAQDRMATLKEKDWTQKTPAERRSAGLKAGLTGKELAYFELTGKMHDPTPTTHISVDTGNKETPHTVQVGDKIMQWNPDSKRYDIEVGPAKPSGRSSSAQTFRDADAVSKWSSDWYNKRRDEANKAKMQARTLAGGKDADPQQLQTEYANIEKQYQEEAGKHEELKKQIYSRLSGGKSVSISAAGELDNEQANADLPPKPNAQPAKSEPTIRYQVGNKYFNIPASKKAAFLRDMPNAKQVTR